MLVSLGCNEEKALIDEARAQHDEGELDTALASLERVSRNKPDTDVDREARKLAATWLIDAADADANPHAARVRLVQALEQDPTSGPAQARLCRLFLRTKQYPAAKQCISGGLEGKKDAPAAIVDEVEAALAAHDDASSNAERKKLLASPSSHHWKALVERYPDSQEAKAAKERLLRFDSLCDDLDRFLVPLRKEIERQAAIAGPIGAAAMKKGRDGRIATYEAIAAEAEKKAKLMKNAAVDADVHAAKKDEEPAKKPLHAALWALSDSAASLAEQLERNAVENLDSYDASATAALTRWSTGFTGVRDRVEKQVAAVEETCGTKRD